MSNSVLICETRLYEINKWTGLKFQVIVSTEISLVNKNLTYELFDRFHKYHHTADFLGVLTGVNISF